MRGEGNSPHLLLFKTPCGCVCVRGQQWGRRHCQHGGPALLGAKEGQGLFADAAGLAGAGQWLLRRAPLPAVHPPVHADELLMALVFRELEKQTGRRRRRPFPVCVNGHFVPCGTSSLYSCFIAFRRELNHFI